MMKIKDSQNLKRILLVLLVLIIGGILISTKITFDQINKLGNAPTPSTNSADKNIAGQKKTYSSKFMKFSIEVPQNFTVNERFATVTITSPEGKIIIDRNGTNYSDLDSYLDNLSELNKLEIRNKEKLEINSLSTIKAFIGKEKVYFIYYDYWLFPISTTSEELYDELDQIAQSFKYQP